MSTSVGGQVSQKIATIGGCILQFQRKTLLTMKKNEIHRSKINFWRMTEDLWDLRITEKNNGTKFRNRNGLFNLVGKGNNSNMSQHIWSCFPCLPISVSGWKHVFRPVIMIENFSVEEVRSWLQSHGLGDLDQVFEGEYLSLPVNIHRAYIYSTRNGSMSVQPFVQYV